MQSNNKRILTGSINKKRPRKRYLAGKKKKNQVMARISRLEAQVSSEAKYLDVSNVDNAVVVSGTFVLLNGMVRGTSSNQRIGQKIRMRRGDLRFVVSLGDTDPYKRMRVIVVVDRQPNGADFTVSELLQTGTSSLGIVSPYNVSTQKRFMIIYDQSFALTISGVGTISKVVRLRLNQAVEYNNGTVGDITDIETNSVYLYYFSDDTTNPMSIYYYHRLWYTDD